MSKGQQKIRQHRDRPVAQLAEPAFDPDHPNVMTGYPPFRLSQVIPMPNQTIHSPAQPTIRQAHPLHSPRLAAVLSLRALKISYNHRMTYLVPFILTLKPNEKAPPPAIFFPNEPDIPPDTYQLQEMYCANPTCHCQEALLMVISVASGNFVADIRVSLNPNDMPNPRLDHSENTAPFAQALFTDIAQDLFTNLDYLSLLRAHYDHVKAVAADPSHPAHATILKWGKTGNQKPPTNKPKRKRH